MLGHRHSSLWHMILAPTVWAVHFCVVYGWTAVQCVRAGGPDAARTGILVATAVALVVIVVLGWKAWKQWDYLDDFDYVHDQPTTEHRREFLGHAGWLLAIVSAIGSDLKVKGILAKTVAALAEAGISIQAVHQSIRQVEMQCVVQEEDYDAAIAALHRALIEPENHGDVIVAA